MAKTEPKKCYQKLSKQEYADIQSAVSIAIQHSPKDSPEFKAALVALDKKLWNRTLEGSLTSTIMDRVLTDIKKGEKNG